MIVKIDILLIATLLIQLLNTSCHKERKPQLEIIGIENISSSSAQVFFSYLDKGTTGIYDRGICWNTEPTPTIENSYSTDCGCHSSCYGAIAGLNCSTTYYVRAYAKNDAGLSYSNEVTFHTSAGNTFIDRRDGEHYQTVQIGNQIWMSENLKFKTNYGSYFYLNNSIEYSKFGRLYKWEVAEIACPDGWRLPTDEDWKELEKHLGIIPSDIEKTDWRGENLGGELKLIGESCWVYPNLGATNKTGFSAIASGYYSHSTNNFDLNRYSGFYWSSTEASENEAWGRGFSYMSSSIMRDIFNKQDAISIRCIKEN